MFRSRNRIETSETAFHLRARMVLLFVGSLEVVLSVMNLNQGGSRSKMGCSFRFRCQNCISTQSELKRAIFRFWRRKVDFEFVSVHLKLETRQNICAFNKGSLALGSMRSQLSLEKKIIKFEAKLVSMPKNENWWKNKFFRKKIKIGPNLKIHQKKKQKIAIFFKKNLNFVLT